MAMMMMIVANRKLDGAGSRPGVVGIALGLLGTALMALAVIACLVIPYR